MEKEFSLKLMEFGGAAASMITAAVITLRYYFKRKILLERHRQEWMNRAMDQFSNNVTRLESEGKDTRLTLHKNMEATAELSGKMEVMREQVGHLLEVQPKFLELMKRFNQRLEEKVSRSRVKGISEDIARVESRAIKPEGEKK